MPPRGSKKAVPAAAAAGATTRAQKRPAEEQAVPATPVKRGRPPKQAQAAPATPVKRGRPPKRPPAVQQPAEEEQPAAAPANAAARAAKSAGRQCLVCGATNPGAQWYRHPATRAEWICTLHYREARREMKGGSKGPGRRGRPPKSAAAAAAAAAEAEVEEVAVVPAPPAKRLGRPPRQAAAPAAAAPAGAQQAGAALDAADAPWMQLYKGLTAHLQACGVSLQEAQRFKVKVLACPDDAARVAHCFEVHNAVATGEPEVARSWVKAVLAG